jgi:hypothetical protein
VVADEDVHGRLAIPQLRYRRSHCHDDKAGNNNQDENYENAPVRTAFWLAMRGFKDDKQSANLGSRGARITRS